MLKIHLLKPQENWILDRLISEFSSKTSHEIVRNPNDADVIWLFARWIWNHYPLEILKNKKVVMTWHHIVPEKFNKEEFYFCDNFVNEYHVPNKHTENFLKNYTNKPIKKLCYWLNDKLFFPKSVSREKYNLPKDKTIIFSNFRDTEGAGIKNNIFLPKLEKSPDIFCDILEKLNREKIYILLSGWRRQYVVERLKKANIGFSYFEMFEDINELYNLSDLTLIPSRTEGGPQSILEGAQTRCDVLSTNVGIADDVLHPECVCPFSPILEREAAIDWFASSLKKSPIKFTDYNFKSAQNFLLDKMTPFYDKMLEDVLK